jgi:DNA-binding response OmpR family regulator
MGVFSRTRPELVVLDVCRPGEADQDLCHRIRLTSEVVPLLVLGDDVGHGDPVQSLRLGADGFIAKPFTGYELLARVRTAMRQ